MRIVIAGAGEVGYRLASSLAGRHDVYVIENNPSRYESLLKLDVEAVFGNAANIRTLKSANVKDTDIFLAVTGNDEVNLLSGLAAKKLGAKIVIVRVENPEYVDRPIVRNHPMGYDVIICPQLALAQEVTRLISIPGAVEVVSFSGGNVEMVEVQVSEDSPASGKTIRDLNVPRNVVITTIYRKDEIIIPRGDTEIKPGDRIALVGKTEDIEKVKDLFGYPIFKRVTIFGGGTIGCYIARVLERGRVSVKLIESKEERCEELCEHLKKTKIVCGDATDIELLTEEEIGKSDIVVATTESDERNLLISLLSKSLGAKMAIAKVENSEYVKLFERVGVDIALNPRRVTYVEVMKLLRRMKIETLAEIEGAAVVEVIVRNPKLSNKKLRDIVLPKNSIVGAVVRDNECLIPRGDTEIRKGDRLLVFTTWDEIEEVEKVFE